MFRALLLLNLFVVYFILYLLSLFFLFKTTHNIAFNTSNQDCKPYPPVVILLPYEYWN